MPNENGKPSMMKAEGDAFMDLRSGNAQVSGLEAVGNIYPMLPPFSIRSDGTTSRGTERSSNTLTGGIKQLYLKFFDAREAGELPKGMTWAKYQELHR